MDIVDKLIEYQQQKSLTDKDMADLFKCSVPLYRKVRTRTTPVSRRILNRISVAIPDMRRYAVQYLVSLTLPEANE